MDLAKKVTEHLEKLSALVYLKEWGTFTKTAAAMGLAQSSLSDQIKTLENALNLRLILRKQGRCEFTPDGERLLQLGLEIKHSIQNFEESFRIRDQNIKEIRIGTKLPYATHVWPRYLNELNKTFPNLSYRFSTPHTNRELVKKLADNDLDLLLMARPEMSSEVRVFKLFSDRFGYFRGRGGKVASRPIIFKNALTPNALRLGDLFEDDGSIVIETESFEVSIAMALQGVGTAIAPLSVAEDSLRAGLLEEISLPPSVADLPPLEVWLCIPERRYLIPFFRNFTQQLLAIARYATP